MPCTSPPATILGVWCVSQASLLISRLHTLRSFDLSTAPSLIPYTMNVHSLYQTRHGYNTKRKILSNNLWQPTRSHKSNTTTLSPTSVLFLLFSTQFLLVAKMRTHPSSLSSHYVQGLQMFFFFFDSACVKLVCMCVCALCCVCACKEWSVLSYL